MRLADSGMHSTLVWCVGQTPWFSATELYSSEACRCDGRVRNESLSLDGPFSQCCTDGLPGRSHYPSPRWTPSYKYKCDAALRPNGVWSWRTVATSCLRPGKSVCYSDVSCGGAFCPICCVVMAVVNAMLNRVRSCTGQEMFWLVGLLSASCVELCLV